MGNCSQCQTDAGKDPIELRDGTLLCTACFGQRYEGEADMSVRRARLLDVIETLRNVVIVGVVGLFVYFGYHIYLTQSEINPGGSSLALTAEELARVKAQVAATEKLRMTEADLRLQQD